MKREKEIPMVVTNTDLDTIKKAMGNERATIISVSVSIDKNLPEGKQAFIRDWFYEKNREDRIKRSGERARGE